MRIRVSCSWSIDVTRLDPFVPTYLRNIWLLYLIQKQRTLVLLRLLDHFLLWLRHKPGRWRLILLWLHSSHYEITSQSSCINVSLFHCLAAPLNDLIEFTLELLGCFLVRFSFDLERLLLRRCPSYFHILSHFKWRGCQTFSFKLILWLEGVFSVEFDIRLLSLTAVIFLGWPYLLCLLMGQFLLNSLLFILLV